MALRRTTRRWIRAGVWLAVVLCACALGFVAYILCFPYETETDLHSSEIPSSVRLQFDRMYPGARNVEWAREDELVEAEFDQVHDEMEAYFTSNGVWVMTEYEGDADDLPPRAVEYLDSFDGYQYRDSVAHVVANESPIAFKVDLESRLMAWECFFDSEGNLVSKKRDGAPIEDQ